MPCCSTSQALMYCAARCRMRKGTTALHRETVMSTLIREEGLSCSLLTHGVLWQCRRFNMAAPDIGGAYRQTTRHHPAHWCGSGSDRMHMEPPKLSLRDVTLGTIPEKDRCPQQTKLDCCHPLATQAGPHCWHARFMLSADLLSLASRWTGNYCMRGRLRSCCPSDVGACQRATSGLRVAQFLEACLLLAPEEVGCCQPQRCGDLSCRKFCKSWLRR
mmetsp:Transcript_98739/g.171071  ORF Transcript_98739/g.171071 Transcript_98739/m.171071 type:complete len:217 (+) Transcript_98739:2-652(+)